MDINLIADDSVASAPAGFTSAVQAAAELFDENIAGNYTVNITYGWGTYDNASDSIFDTESNAASIGGPAPEDYVSYSDFKSWLTAAATTDYQSAAAASLPSASPFPGQLVISPAQEKALGVFTGGPNTVDGSLDFNTDDATNGYFPKIEEFAVTEIAHALGMFSGDKADDDNLYTQDLFRFTAPGVNDMGSSQPSYFSLDYGQTDLANYSATTVDQNVTDPTLFDDIENEAFSLPVNFTDNIPFLTDLDLDVLGAMGFAPIAPETGTGSATGAGTGSGTGTGSNFSVADTSTGATSAAAGDIYSGPVAGLQYQYINMSSDNLNVTAEVANSFIHTGSGFDAIDVSKVGGTNVLDGGTGSNFLVGGTGSASNDTFFVDDRGPTADIWSTVANFHAGDSATVFGITRSGFSTDFFDGQGASGYTGLTLHATAAGVPTASITLAGYSMADLGNGTLSTTFGSESDGTPYLYIHANS